MTARRFTGGRLAVASHNPGKVTEIRDLLEPFGVDTVSSGELDLPEPEETGSTFVENARIKALATALAAGMPALADDSGIAVEALGGDPGIYSARWAEPGKDFMAAMTTIEQKVRALGPDVSRRASFVCALCLAWPDGHAETFEGIVEGTLVWPPRGARGFGYDPAFLPDGHEQTFGEMDPDAKHAISHRAMAFGKLVDACFDKPG